MTLQNKIFSDSRGFNMKFFEEHLAKAKGFKEVKEVFATTNKKGTVRAFHYQAGPKPQQKIIKPLNGKFNVKVIDVEKEKVISYDNVDNTSDPIFVKAGNLLGYVSLEENSVMLYIADEEFDAKLNEGISPFSFSVNWGRYFISNDILKISSRDKEAQVIDKFEDL